MTIFRVVHNKNYTTINNYISTDNRLSYRAKGIWMYAFSRRDDWDFYLKDLINQSTDGRDAVRSGLKELEDCGYLVRRRVRISGCFKGYDWTFYETPQDFKKIVPQTAFPTSVKPTSENRPLTSTELLSTEEEQTNNLEEEDPSDEKDSVLFVCSSPIENEKEKRELLSSYDFSKQTLAELLPFSIDRIQDAITALDQYSKEKPTVNPSGWLRKAIVNNWKPNITKQDRQVAKQKMEMDQYSLIEDNVIKVKSLIEKNKHLFVFKKFGIELSDNVAYVIYPKGVSAVDLTRSDAILILNMYLMDQKL